MLSLCQLRLKFSSVPIPCQPHIEVKNWDHVQKCTATTVNMAFKEAVNLLQFVQTVESSLTVEHFVKAAVAIKRFQFSKNVRGVQAFVKEQSDGTRLTHHCTRQGRAVIRAAVPFGLSAFKSKFVTVSGDGGETAEEPLPEGVVSLAKATMDCCASHAASPAAWARSLINSGKVQALLDLDATTRGNLDPAVDKMLRTATVVRSMELPPDDGRPCYFAAEIWSTRQEIQEGTMAFLEVDVKAGLQDDLKLSELQNVCEVLEAKLVKTTTALCESLVHHRDEASSIWSHLQVMIDKNSTPEAVGSTLQMFCSEEQKMQKAVEGTQPKFGHAQPKQRHQPTTPSPDHAPTTITVE